MSFFSKKKHLSVWAGCFFFFTLISESTKRNSNLSVLIEDEDCILVEETEDGTIKEWGNIRPGSTIDVPDDTDFELINRSQYDPMTLIEEDNPDLPVNIDYQESVKVIESETGDLGYEKENAEGDIKLITNAENYNKLHSDEEPTELEADNISENNERTPNYTQVRTITKLPPKDDALINWDDSYGNSISEPTTLTNQNSWWTAPVIGGSFLTLGLIGFYYLSKTAAECARYFAQDGLWSSWKSEESYETLLMIEPKHLANKLIPDINITYYQEENPIKLFLRDIQEEHETILQWIQFKNILCRLRLPLGNEFNNMRSRLALLEHMRKAVRSWRAQEMSKA